MTEAASKSVASALREAAALLKVAGEESSRHTKVAKVAGGPVINLQNLREAAHAK